MVPKQKCRTGYASIQLTQYSSVSHSLGWKGLQEVMQSSCLLKTGSALNLEQVAQGFVQLGLENLQGQRLHILSGPLFQCLTENPVVVHLQWCCLFYLEQQPACLLAVFFLLKEGFVLELNL